MGGIMEIWIMTGDKSGTIEPAEIGNEKRGERRGKEKKRKRG